MLGTSGTFVGTARRLKELNPKIRCISLQPDSPFHGIEGAKYMPSSIVPKIYDPDLADCNLEISTEEAYAAVKRLAREEGLLAVSPLALPWPAACGSPKAQRAMRLSLPSFPTPPISI